MVTFIPLNQRLRGPRHVVLVNIKPNEPLYDRLMPYRYYRPIGEHQEFRIFSLNPFHK